MTPTEAIRILRQHNKWRRSNADEPEMLNPKVIGAAIDVACDSLEQSMLFVESITEEKRQIKAAIKDGGFTLAECMICNRVIVANPDGLYMCVECAAREGEDDL